VSILLASTGAALLILTAWPLPKRTLTSPFPPAYSLDYPEMQPVLLERENTIVIPEKLRAGQTGTVKFSFQANETAKALPQQGKANHLICLKPHSPGSFLVNDFHLPLQILPPVFVKGEMISFQTEPHLLAAKIQSLKFFMIGPG